MIILDKILIDSNKSKRMKDAANGYLTIFGNPIAVAGVYPYRRYEVDDSATESNSHDIVKVYRPVENLIEIKDNFARKPIIRDHEWVGKNGTKTNVDGAIGSEVWNINNALIADISIYNPDVINDIESGVCTELSPGYQAEIIPQNGSYKGESYEYIMNIKSVNHLAIVNKGRAGSELRLLDKGDSIMKEDKNELLSDSEKGSENTTTVSTDTSVCDSKILEEQKIQKEEEKVNNFLTIDSLKSILDEFKNEIKTEINERVNMFQNEINEFTSIKNRIEFDTGLKILDSIKSKDEIYSYAYENLSGHKLPKGYDARTAYEVLLIQQNQGAIESEVAISDSNENLKNDTILDMIKNIDSISNVKTGK